MFITAYNEDADTLENTISACTLMNYGNKQIYLLDDSTNHELKRTSVALAEKYGIGYAHRENRRGFKAGAINDMLTGLDAKYLLIIYSLDISIIILQGIKSWQVKQGGATPVCLWRSRPP